MVLGSLVGPVALAAAALFILNGGAQAARPRCRAGGVGGDGAAHAGHAAVRGRDLVVAAPVLQVAAVAFAAVRVADGTPGGKATLLPYEVPLTLSEFAPDRFPGSRPGRPAFPELLVCAAVNVSDPGTTAPGRNGLSFVFSPSRIGHPDPVVVPGMAGWRRRLLHPTQVELDTEAYGPLEVDTADYEGRVGTRRRRHRCRPR